MLASSPIQITETTIDTSAIILGMSSATDMPDLSQIGDKVYVNSFLTNIAHGMTVSNNLSDKYLRYLDEDMDKSLYRAIMYDTGMQLDNALYTSVEIENSEGVMSPTVISLSALKEYYTYKLSQLEAKYATLSPLVEYLGDIYGKMPGTADTKSADYGEYVLSQYEIVGEGHFPTNHQEAVLVIGTNNDMTDLTLSQLGFIGEEEFLSLFPQGEQTNEDLEDMMIPYEEIVGKKLMLNYNDAIYTENTAMNAEYMYTYEGSREQLDLGEGTGIEITISGILRLKEGLTQGCLSSGLYFTEELYQEYQKVNMESKIAKTIQTQMQKVTEYNALSMVLKELDKDSEEYTAKMQEMVTFFMTNSKYFKPAAQTLLDYYISGAAAGDMMGDSEEEGDSLSNSMMIEMLKKFSFLYDDSALRVVGGKDKVNAISIYTDSFEAKEGVLAHLEAWNDTCAKEDVVKYTDMVGDMMKMVETMLNAITYVLVAFTAISLVVSSVMIGIITYVSVVERTKEIGVLRSLGARKKDIKNLFNAETFIIGLASGVFGVAVTYLISIAVNAILGVLTGISTLASLPFGSAVIMIVISITLTLISGLIPAGAAARKDPVIALRTE